MTKRGPKPTFENTRKIAATLSSFSEGTITLSRYLALQLVEKGYLEAVTEKQEGRGRPRVRYVLTGKGRGLIALSKNWGKKAA